VSTYALVVALAAWLGLVVLGSVLFQVMRQQGGLLLRLEATERRLEALETAGPARQNGARPEGLAVGSELPAVRLPDYAGRTWGLADIHSERILLVHWSPACGFCEQIADDLAALSPAMTKRSAELVLMSLGDVEANRAFAQQHGLRCPVLLLEGCEASSPFAGLGTPVAYLLDAQRRVERPLAFGADEVLELASEVAGHRRIAGQRPLSESRLERNGLPAGTPAPDFQLPTLDGDTLSLAQLRGRAVLLVFSQPDCNPCTGLTTDLQDLHARSAPDLTVVVISRGDEEQNRRKRDEAGARYPIVLQQGWQTSRDYGIFETPVAFLIDADGVIAHEVARGPTEILELAQRATRASEVRPLQSAV